MIDNIEHNVLKASDYVGDAAVNVKKTIDTDTDNRKVMNSIQKLLFLISFFLETNLYMYYCRNSCYYTYSYS